MHNFGHLQCGPSALQYGIHMCAWLHECGFSFLLILCLLFFTFELHSCALRIVLSTLCSTKAHCLVFSLWKNTTCILSSKFSGACRRCRLDSHLHSHGWHSIFAGEQEQTCSSSYRRCCCCHCCIGRQVLFVRAWFSFLSIMFVCLSFSMRFDYIIIFSFLILIVYLLPLFFHFHLWQWAIEQTTMPAITVYTPYICIL